jgi:hypothetical protein
MTITSQTITASHTDVARRLLANVDAGTSDQSPGQMKVPATSYRDPARWEAEMERIYRRSPLAVALSCDVREPGDFDTVEIQRFHPMAETLRFYKDSKGNWHCKDPDVRLVSGLALATVALLAQALDLSAEERAVVAHGARLPGVCGV